jgi:methyltransferase (TIGR00027 family)
LGVPPEKIVADSSREPDSEKARRYMATRSRIGEDWLHAAYGRGVRQMVVLGAGFDTFGLRNPYHDLRVFEVDHQATQMWKRERLAAEGLSIPPTLTFVSVNFSVDDLVANLTQGGFDKTAAAFFLWLGVVPYLDQEAVFKTLASIAEVRDAEVVFDYSEPLDNFPASQQPYIAAMSRKVAAAGEPWVSFFDPNWLAGRLREMGFLDVEDLDRNAVVNWVAETKRTGAKAVGPHMVRARR